MPKLTQDEASKVFDKLQETLDSLGVSGVVFFGTPSDGFMVETKDLSDLDRMESFLSVFKAASRLLE